MSTKSLASLSLAICGLFHGMCAAQTTPSTRSDTPRKDASTKADDNELNVRLGDTLRQLTRVRLERAMQINSKVPGTYLPEDIETIKGELAVIDAQERTKGKISDWFSTLVGLAESSKLASDADWKRIAALRQQNPGGVTDLDAEMIRLRAQLAEINLQRGRKAANGTADEKQNWAILYLTMELQRVKDEIQLLDERTR